MKRLQNIIEIVDTTEQSSNSIIFINNLYYLITKNSYDINMLFTINSDIKNNYYAGEVFIIIRGKETIPGTDNLDGYEVAPYSDNHYLNNLYNDEITTIGGYLDNIKIDASGNEINHNKALLEADINE